MTAVLDLDRIKLHGEARTRDDAIREVGGMLVQSGSVTQAYADAMFDREATVSTYMGNFLAIPHGTNEGREFIDATALAVIRYPEAIAWDGDEVRFVIGIAGRENEHLEILGRIAVLFSDDDEVAALLAAGSATELYDRISAVNDD